MKTTYLFCLLFILNIPFVFAQTTSRHKTWYIAEQNLTTYKRIRLSGVAHIFLQKGTQEAMRIEVKEQDILNHVRAEIKGEELHIRSIRAGVMNPNIRIYLTYQDLESIQIDGKANIESQNTLELERLKLDINGFAKTYLNLAVKDLVVTVAGYGLLNLSGKADYQSFNLSGSGKIHASQLNGDYARAEISGWGTIEVNAQKQLRAEVNGVGKVLYAGNPSLSTSRAGITSIRPLDW
ncbi:MAG: DUF2807 domain-containing protein [Microscillaceae bacterium]|jgi:hypothetical protein|nr:DUF2807 domain-containing protein [Microscillaceae bacterium]